MGNRAKWWVMASILAAVLCAAGPSKAEEEAQPTAFNSAVAFDVYAVIGQEHDLLIAEEDEFVGSTPSERPLTRLVNALLGDDYAEFVVKPLAELEAAP